MIRLVALAAGFVTLVGMALFTILFVALGPAGGTPWIDLDVGECFDLAGAIAESGEENPLVRVETLPCDAAHDAQLVATGELDPDRSREYPPDDVLFELVDRQCSVDVGDGLDRSVYGLLPIAPDEKTWNEKRGRYACVAVVAGGGTVSESAIDWTPGAS